MTKTKNNFPECICGASLPPAGYVGIAYQCPWCWRNWESILAEVDTPKDSEIKTRLVWRWVPPDDLADDPYPTGKRLSFWPA